MENTDQTKQSGKQIQEIWSDAFKTGKAVKLRGKTINKCFTEAWFECVDGRTYPLTKQELKEYKPNARIRNNFRRHDKGDTSSKGTQTAQRNTRGRS